MVVHCTVYEGRQSLTIQSEAPITEEGVMDVYNVYVMLQKKNEGS